MSSKQPVVVAIDGPVGVGKSTVAERVARRLGLPHLETGGMYRALALDVLEAGVDPEDAVAVERLLEGLELSLRVLPDGTVQILRGGRTLGPEARRVEVGQATSKIAASAPVRAWMVSRQREFAAQRGAVLEGRDIGSRVFPSTPYKFYLDAPVSVRARRRQLQLGMDGDAELDRLTRQIAERDRRDMTRAESPLVCDQSYQRIDTSSLSLDEVVEQVVERVEAIRARQ